MRAVVVVVAILVVAAGGALIALEIGHHVVTTPLLKNATTTILPQTTTTTFPPTTTTVDPVCEQNAPTNGCPLGTPAAIAWAQEQDQAAQAAATEQAEQAYEQCLSNDAQADAAAIAQEFGRVSLGGTPTFAGPCSTAGLTPAEVQQAQQAEGG